jgi:lipopolysaccharide/colanic/teichoic acid biosynthesis glycosyltransferase
MSFNFFARKTSDTSMLLPKALRALSQERFQLAGAITFAAILPLMAWSAWGKPSALGGYAQTTLIVTIAIFLSHILVGGLMRYPAPSSLAISLPAVTAAFGIVVIGIILTHADYSRGVLISGFLVTLVWYTMVGVDIHRYTGSRLALVPVGTTSSLTRLRETQWYVLSSPSPEDMKDIQGVVADLQADLPLAWRKFLTSCAIAGIPVYDSTQLKEMLTGQVELNRLSDFGFDALLPHRTYFMAKNTVDFILAVLALPLVLVMIAIVAIAIRIETSGPVLFVQDRVGYRGRVFRCFKLRSMRISTADDGLPYTTSRDPRVTRVGAFMRRYRIDELPQIFNILKGEMSWIGPRPEALPLSRHYEKSVPSYIFRHTVKPGISGWAAIHQGNVGGVDAATMKLRYDFYYIKNSSFTLDLYIAYRTAVVLLTGFGSK